MKNTFVSPSIFEAEYVLKEPVNIKIDSSYDALLLSLSIAEYREAPRTSAAGRGRAAGAWTPGTGPTRTPTRPGPASLPSSPWVP